MAGHRLLSLFRLDPFGLSPNRRGWGLLRHLGRRRSLGRPQTLVQQFVHGFFQELGLFLLRHRPLCGRRTRGARLYRHRRDIWREVGAIMRRSSRLMLRNRASSVTCIAGTEPTIIRGSVSLRRKMVRCRRRRHGKTIPSRHRADNPMRRRGRRSRRRSLLQTAVLLSVPVTLFTQPVNLLMGWVWSTSIRRHRSFPLRTDRGGGATLVISRCRLSLQR